MEAKVNISNVNEVKESLRVFDKGFFYSLGRHIKDLMGIGLMYLGVIIGVCAVEVEKEKGLFSAEKIGTEPNYIRLDCFNMLRQVTMIGIILLVINALIIWYGLGHKQTIKYRLAHYLVNIVLYISAISRTSYACTEPGSQCINYKEAVIIFSGIMIAIYGICAIITVIRKKTIEAQLEKAE